MKLLVLGGTAFIGRHVVEHALAAGHAVSVFNRGVSPGPLPPSVERLRGDRDRGDVAALAGRLWDACIDLSGYTTTQLRSTARVLQGRVGHYVYVSAVMAYGDVSVRPVREWHPRLPPWTGEVAGTDAVDGTNYGALKVANEDLVGASFAGRNAVLRPQVVAGPFDPSDRVAWWRRHAARRGPVRLPGDGTDHVQFVDVRDLARFAVQAASGLGGAFNVAGPRLTWAAFASLLQVARPVWSPADEVLREHGGGLAALPLYRHEHGRFAGLMDVSAERALAAGLTHTDPAVTLRDSPA